MLIVNVRTLFCEPTIRARSLPSRALRRNWQGTCKHLMRWRKGWPSQAGQTLPFLLLFHHLKIASAHPVDPEKYNTSAVCEVLDQAFCVHEVRFPRAKVSHRDWGLQIVDLRMSVSERLFTFLDMLRKFGGADWLISLPLRTDRVQGSDYLHNLCVDDGLFFPDP